MSEHEKNLILYFITRWVKLNQKTISHYCLFKHYSEDQQKAYCVPNHLSISGLVRGRGGIGVVKSQATHGGGPIGPQWCHQIHLFSVLSSFLGGPINPQAVREKVARTP
jgi:hypothetical protein